MAYGSWINQGWKLVKDVYDSNYSQYGYEIHVEWGYKQDKVANKTTYRATRVKLVSKNGHRVYSSNNTTAGIGVGSDDAYRVEVSGLDTLMDESGDEVIQDLTNVSREVSHNEDGTLSTYCSIHGKYYVNVSVSGVPENEWYSVNITSSIPAIDRSAPTAGISVSSKTYNSVTLKLTSSNYANVCRYRINSGDWVEFSTANTSLADGSGALSKTITGLAANTTYTIEFQVCRTMNGVWSDSASVTFTTPKPATPTAGKVSVSSKTHKTLVCAISGFSFGDGATWGKYQYSLDNSSWKDIGTSTSFTISGLSPNTSYKVYVRLVDNYGTASSSVSTSGTTNKPDAPTKGSVSVSSKTHNSVTCTISGFSFGDGAAFGKYQWSLDGSTWTSISSNTSFTVTGLSPNTQYTIYVRLVDNYSTASSNATVTVTTNKPDAATAGKVSVSNITAFGGKFSWSGFSFGSGATWGKYQYSTNGSSWTDCGTNTSITLNNLSPETTYTFYVRLVDNYGTASNSATVQFTTIADQAKVRIKTANEWEQGKWYIKINGEWVKAKKAYKKINGAWKVNKN